MQCISWIGQQSIYHRDRVNIYRWMGPQPILELDIVSISHICSVLVALEHRDGHKDWKNQNFMNKTIKKLKISENTTLTEQKSILAQIKKFYENLFSNKDDIDETKLDDTFAGLNANKLTEQESKSIEGLLTLPELSKALKHMQNNKTPGLDGFPADFYKFG